MPYQQNPNEEYAAIYVQSSNPSQELLDWVKQMSEEGRVVYLQSGTPPPPPGGPPK